MTSRRPRYFWTNRTSTALHCEAEFIQKFLGHSSITITMDTYGTLSIGEMQQIIAQKTGDYTLIGEAKSIRPALD